MHASLLIIIIILNVISCTVCILIVFKFHDSCVSVPSLGNAFVTFAHNLKCLFSFEVVLYVWTYVWYLISEVGFKPKDFFDQQCFVCFLMVEIVFHTVTYLFSVDQGLHLTTGYRFFSQLFLVFPLIFVSLVVFFVC